MLDCCDGFESVGCDWIASQTVKKVIPVSRLSRGEDKPTDKPTPGLLGTMAGGAAVSSFHDMVMLMAGLTGC